MKFQEAKKLYEEITTLCYSEGNLFFFGCGEICVKMLEYFTKYHLPFPVGICDNSKVMQGTFMKGIPIISWEEACKSTEPVKVIVTSLYYGNEIEQEILATLPHVISLNLQEVFQREDTTIYSYSKSKEDYTRTVKRYTGMLRGQNQDLFSLKSPEDMPEYGKLYN